MNNAIRQNAAGSGLSSRGVTSVVFAIFLLSGAAGLIYQVVWTRDLMLTFGSTVFAVSAVLTAFMAGMALGSWVISRWADRIGNRLRLYGIMEIGIGVYALLFPLLLQGASSLYVELYRSFGLGFFPLTLVKFALSLILLIIPTFLMGGTLPVLSRFIVRRLQMATRQVAYLYALNTAGAVAGTIVAGFLLVPLTGLLVSSWVAVALNLLVGLIALLLARHDLSEFASETSHDPATAASISASAASTARRDRTPTPQRHVRLAFIVMFFTGLISLGYEVIWTRSLLLYMGSTNYTFSTMLTAFLFGIAAGSFVLGIIAPKIRRPLLWLGLAEAGIGASIFLTLPGLWQVSRLMETPGFEALSWEGYNLAKFGLCFAVMLIPTLLMGATFPLAAQVVIRNVQHLGRSVGSVYSINTLGAILGSALTGLVLMPLMGPGPAFVLLAAGNLLLAAVVFLFAGQPRWRTWAVLSLGLLVLLLVVQKDLTRLARKTVLERIARQGEILFEADGLEAHVAVQEDVLGHRQLWVNGDVVARSTGSVSGHNLLGHLPMLFAEDNRETLVIALGTGISAGSTSLYDPATIDVVEISSLVRENVYLFAHDNYSLHENPKTNFIIDDGRNFVEIADGKYDVVAAEPLHPWKAGVANMYTKEYYELCLDLLNPGGVAVQWIPLYGLNDQDARDLTRTFVDVFPETSYWLFGFDAVLLGHHGEFSIDLPKLTERLSPPGVWHDLNKVRIFSEIDLINHLVMGPEELPAYTATGRVMRDRHPFIEYDGPKHVHAGRPNSEILLALCRHRGNPADYISGWGERPDSLRAMIEHQNAVWSTVIEGVIAQQAERDLRRSEALLKGAIHRAPWMGDAKYYLSRTYFMMGSTLGQRGGTTNIQEALRYYEQGLALVPGSPSLLSRAANASERLGQNEAAIQYLARLLDVLPEHARMRDLAQQRISALRSP